MANYLYGIRLDNGVWDSKGHRRKFKRGRQGWSKRGAFYTGKSWQDVMGTSYKSRRAAERGNSFISRMGL